MNTAYNTNTTTVQESRNRYNALLAQALERLKARKTDETAQPETTTATEVTTTSTDQPEDEPTPYWLLLDNELRAQQEEQEQAPATPEKSEEEPAEEPDNEETDDPEGVVFLNGAELNKVIEDYADQNGLDLKEQKRYYYFYATADGYIAKLSKPKPKRNLYIADEAPFYNKYESGEIDKKDIFLSNNLQTIRGHKQMALYTPEKGKTECDLFVTICSNSDNTYIEMPNRQTSPREVAVYEAVHRLYISDQRARLEKYWNRYSDKVWVDTYWVNR